MEFLNRLNVFYNINKCSFNISLCILWYRWIIWTLKQIIYIYIYRIGGDARQVAKMYTVGRLVSLGVYDKGRNQKENSG